MFAELENTSRLVLHDKLISNETKKVEKSNVFYNATKRSFDIFSAILGCLFLLIISIVLKIAFLITGDTAPLFYTQKRIGKGGREFKLYKFRSMVPNADAMLAKILLEDERLAKEYSVNKKLENDPRITKVGKFIRRTSIDELPQILNILKGDMSIIGNRPYLPREKEDMGSYYDDIVKTKPGLTGFWQCSLRSRGTFEDRLKMEKFYSNNYDIKFDITILLKTVKVVLNSEGAK